MIDFKEYVVSELKSKRLSKTNAISLIKQFYLKSKSDYNESVIHPLLHRNTSDLNQQSYATIFSGREFFLKDHQVNSKKILPGVAYLEMVRAAIDKAIPRQEESTIIELKNFVWVQPIVVTEPKEVTIALFSNENKTNDNQIEFEIYSAESDSGGNYKETIHSQGHVVIIAATTPAKLDIEQLRTQMKKREFEASEIYSVYEKIGLFYGPSHRGIDIIYKGEQQLLAQLNIPNEVDDTFSDYVLHPSLMDSVLQSALGLIENIKILPTRPSLPFALESLRILSKCTKKMVSWLRYSPGSLPEGKTIKLDIDLCDMEGNICVEMRGFTSRELNTNVNTTREENKRLGSLYATSVWNTTKAELATKENRVEYSQRYIVLCGIEGVNAKQLESVAENIQCLPLKAVLKKNSAEGYCKVALACFELIKKILARKPLGKTLIQVVVANSKNESFLIGLNGLLKTAAIENPMLIGQIIFAESKITTSELVENLETEKLIPQDTVIKYEQGIRHVLKLQEIEVDEEDVKIAFKDEGVYLITGGLGGLGILFTKEILKQSDNAKIILTGRSELTSEKKAILDSLPSRRGTVKYQQLDITNPDKVRQLISKIVKQNKKLTGIIHSAGVILDNFILKKTNEEFCHVLAPKVTGTLNLDEASRELELDFFVLFSSVSANFGNQGQADYSTANGFMDQYAVYRNQLVNQRQRYGKTVSFNWPLWKAGGMAVDKATEKVIQQTSGMQAMDSVTGLSAFYLGLQSTYTQTLIMQGDIAQLRRTLEGETILTSSVEIKNTSSTKALLRTVNKENSGDSAGLEYGSLTEKIQEYLRQEFSLILKLPKHKIDAQAALEKYGIDSILAMNITNQLEKTFGSLAKTLFFEYQTIEQLGEYFLQNHSELLISLFNKKENYNDSKVKTLVLPSTPTAKIENKPIINKHLRRSRYTRVMQTTHTSMLSVRHDEPIAIIGLSGRYPEAPNLETYWNNLETGKDCITEVPNSRWDWREYYSEDRHQTGRHFSKWGGFIEGVDEFDPRFFNISPREAEFIDPQERLFLQHVWMAVEDAGFTRASIQVKKESDLAGQVGVYAGVMYSEYQLFGAEASVSGARIGVGGSFASIANRVSYVFNFHGPSMTIDTMCSSSLTAIHLACQDLKQGRTDAAIAGGVNVSIHPSKYLVLSAGQFISSDGHCQSFGEGGDGYIPGEGVGVVVLKRVSEAKRDGNPIYGTILASTINHGGKTNGYSVPNPKAQSSAISRTLAESNINPRHISYIEAHGTGTKLGDPIEITALSQAFNQYTKEKEFCLIGSAKSNIGHCESAAGIAGLTKVLLQMKYKKIVPSLHSTVLNPHINFKETPFIVNQALRTWNQPVIEGQQLPRIAGLSSFGAGGSNAHLIVQEYITPISENYTSGLNAPKTNVIIPLSARTAEQLEQKVQELLAFIYLAEQEDLKEEGDESSCKLINLIAMSYTLQIGREAMDVRLGFIVQTVEQLVEKLQAYCNGDREIEYVYQGQVKYDKDPLSALSTDVDFQETINRWMANKKLSNLLELWVNGINLDWNNLYGEHRPKRISLPTYPFAKERYWVGKRDKYFSSVSKKAAPALHPLLHTNTSNINQYSFRTKFSGDEFFLVDRQLNADSNVNQKMLSAMTYLEMARAAVIKISAEKIEASSVELDNVLWGQPYFQNKENDLNIALFVISADDNNKQIEFEIYSKLDGHDVIHCQGQAIFTNKPTPMVLDLDKIKVKIGQVANQLLADLNLPENFIDTHTDFTLHPSMMDNALLLSIELFSSLDQTPSPLFIPIAIESLNIFSATQKNMRVWVRHSQGYQAEDKLPNLDLDFCDLQGHVLVQIRGLSLQELIISPDQKSSIKLVTPKAEIIPSTLDSTKQSPVYLRDLNNLVPIVKGSTTKKDVLSANVPLNSSNKLKRTSVILPSDIEEVGYSREKLIQELKTTLAEALYLNPSELDVGKPFVDLGLDSIVGVEWVKVINKQYGLNIPATRVYDYSNLKKFAQFLENELKNPSNLSAKQVQISTQKENSTVRSDRSTLIRLANLQEALSVPISREQVRNSSSVNLSQKKIKCVDNQKTNLSFEMQSTVYTNEELLKQLKISLAKALYLEPSEIDIGKPFVDLGLDSIIGVEWVKAINKQYGLDIPATRVYDYSNLREFVSFLDKERKKLFSPSQKLAQNSEGAPTNGIF